ncbi:TPA: hypothetical protein UMB92_001794 [Stenotrophomonas maltophilia]|uniref:hypothetical protein n=1 Tax=Stenotrophomonas maltophilia TaxID=40324 RepID=UPI0015DFBF94|nr:hypothetical protein [Stenotrophomonas maltophilia]MBA0449522.1 hypothetical protein [Stenotrophomonas maltophilia]HEL2978948.1 hypothetical protein [Stenotrophomonas maltophilia]
MSHRTRYPNLHQLVGESVSQLSADVAQRVENLLSRSDGLMPILVAQLDLDDITDGAAQRAGLKPPLAGTLADVRRTVAGITILTRMMYAAHIARTRGGALQVMPPDAVEGLLLAARELTCHAQQQLQAEKARGAATLQ